MLVGPRASGKATTAARHARSVIRFDQPPEAAVVEARLYQLRDQNGDHEIDLIAELDPHRPVAIEIKATAAPRLTAQA